MKPFNQSGSDGESLSRDWRSSFREAGPYLGLGMQLAGGMALFTLGGYLLDRWLGTLPWLTVGGGILGTISVFTLLVRVVRELGKPGKRDKPADSHPDGA